MSTRSTILLLSLLNLVNYIDRFSLAASLSHIQTELQLTSLQSGALMSAFVLPYLFAAIVFGLWANQKNRLNILKFGGIAWGAATIACAFVSGYEPLLIMRSLLGVGEAAFASVAPALLYELASDDERGRKMAFFSAGLPLGLAGGYMGGGWLTEHFGWRTSFVSVGVPALILTAFVFALKDPAKTKISSSGISAKEKVLKLLTSRNFVFALLGYTAYTFVAGGVAYWMPLYTEKAFLVNTAQANAIFGGAAIGFGLIGNFVGGWGADLWQKKSGHGHLKICLLSMLLATIPYYFVFNSGNVTEYIIWVGVTQFFLFLPTGPINVVILMEAGPAAASFAMSASIFVTHLLGDALSPPFIGWVTDRTGELRLGMLYCLPVLLLGALLFSAPLIKPKSNR